MFLCRFRLEEDGLAEEGVADLSFDEKGISLLPRGTPPLTISYSQLDGISSDDASIMLRSGPLRLSLTGLGRQTTGIRQGIQQAWQTAACVGLFRGNSPSWGPFSGRFAFAGKSSRGEALLLPDLLLLFREEGGLTVIPVQLWEEVQFDPQSYAVRLRTRECELLADQLARRSEEFRQSAEEALARTRARLSTLLATLVPGLSASSARALAGTLWREMAIPRNQVEESTWNYLAKALQGKERAETVAYLQHHAQPGQAWWGVAPPPPWDGEGLPLTWFSGRLAPTVLAVEVASAEEGYATYLFRLPAAEADAQSWIQNLHLVWPLVGFHRQLITQERVGRPGEESASWEMAYRTLPTLAQMRDNFLGKAIHGDPETWKRQIELIQKS